MIDHSDEHTPDPKEVLRINRKVYHEVLVQTLLASMGRGELNHESAMMVCLGVAGAIGSDLGNDGIVLFEKMSGSKIEHMQASLEAYEQVTNPKRLQ